MRCEPGTFSSKWGEDDASIIDEHPYLVVDFSADCASDTRIANVLEQGEKHVGKMAAVQADSYVIARMKTVILMNVIILKQEQAADNCERGTRCSLNIWKQHK